MKIKIVMPTKETPGFLRRSKKAAEFAERMKAGVNPNLYDDMVEFILPFIEEPQDRDAARELLWDASQQQFEDIMKAFGGGNDTAVPPPSNPPS